MNQIPLPLYLRFCTAILCGLASFHSAAAEDDLFEIKVIDADNGWPVPLVELRTNHQQRFVTDNAGVIAFDLPELMGQETWFAVRGHGYGMPADRFGYRGVRLTPKAGGRATVKVQRQLPAIRLGRLTGAGLFAESRKLGRRIDLDESGVLGCDSIQTAVHNNQLFWFWGDTTIARYPLGIFHMSGATTPLRPFKEFEPPLQPQFSYFRNSAGRVREVGRMPGDGPTWISGAISLPDQNGQSRLVGCYSKIRPPLEAYETGLCVWDDSQDRFVPHRVLWNKSERQPTAPLCPDGHPVLHTDSRGATWLLFGDPFPRLRCEATFEAWSDPDSWQRLEPQQQVPIRDSDQQVKPHRGSIAFHQSLGKWVTVFTQMYGEPSAFGEIWYAEADVPTGPWRDAVKVVTHDNYTFYNPLLHPELIDADDSFLLFEGTYTATFADQPVPTPRYDYNQILYRLDLPLSTARDNTHQP